MKDEKNMPVIPAKAGIQGFCNRFKFLDSHFRGNDSNVVSSNKRE